MKIRRMTYLLAALLMTVLYLASHTIFHHSEDDHLGGYERRIIKEAKRKIKEGLLDEKIEEMRSIRTEKAKRYMEEFRRRSPELHMSTEPISFEDPNLNECYREARRKKIESGIQFPVLFLCCLGSDEISLTAAADCNKVSNKSQNLRGIEKATGLPTINLSGNNISDLTPLISLPYLTGLDLKNNKINDVSALSTLKRLRYLNLYGNYIKDFLLSLS